MRALSISLAVLLPLVLPPATRAATPEVRPPTPKHFIFFGSQRQRITETSFLTNAHIAGAQLKYSWRELEPARDQYDFHALLADLAVLEQHHKRLFIQLQDVTFSESIPVPDYLRTDPTFHGGVARKYEYQDDNDTHPTFDGWVTRRWDATVRERFQRLLSALGRAVDGRIEGLNLPETAVSFGAHATNHPPGFTYETYLEGVNANLTAARRACPRSTVLQYANFMPGEWLPWTDHGYLRAVYAHAGRIGAGVGGPDSLPHRKGQRNHSYPLIAARAASTPAGIAIQDGNLREQNPATGKLVSVDELYRFATDELRVNYIFWGTEEPFYSRDILPALGRL